MKNRSLSACAPSQSLTLPSVPQSIDSAALDGPLTFNDSRALCTNGVRKVSTNSFPWKQFRTLAKTTKDVRTDLSENLKPHANLSGTLPRMLFLQPIYFQALAHSLAPRHSPISFLFFRLRTVFCRTEGGTPRTHNFPPYLHMHQSLHIEAVAGGVTTYSKCGSGSINVEESHFIVAVGGEGWSV